MRKNLEYSVEAAYPELFEGVNPYLTQEDISDARRFLVNEGTKTAESVDDHIVTHTLDGRAFRMVVRKGESNNLVLAPAEFATGIRGDGWARLMAMKAIMDPFASVILQPQNVLGQNNLNLSPKERAKLRSGNSQPIIDRILKTLEEEGLEYENIDAVGVSLGATLMTDLARHPDANVRSLTAFETPDIKKRKWLSLTKDFLLSGPNLYKNLEISKLGEEADFLSQSKLNLIRFSMGALHANNLATMLRLRTNSHAEGIMKALEKNPGLGVVRGWTARSAISPSYENRETTEFLKMYFGQQVEGIEFAGPLASHNSTNIPVLVGALARRAATLSHAA